MEHAERLCDQLVIMTRGRKVFDGTLSQARALMPRRARIAASGDLNFLAETPGVTAVIPPKEGDEFWEIDLREGAEGQPLLAACFERGIALTHFDISPPSLHDVFMALAAKAQP
jgi:ABC-2 type transport system ATP-binding protein